MNKKLIWGIIIVVVVIGAYCVYAAPTPESEQRSQNCSYETCVRESITPTPTPTLEAKVISPKPVVTTPSVQTGTNTSSWKKYFDTTLKVGFKYPSDWEFFTGNPGYGYAFWVSKSYNAESMNIVRFVKQDGCKPGSEVTIAGERALDSNWSSSVVKTRTICFPAKQFSISLTATDAAAKVMEDEMIAAITFVN